MIEKHLYLKCLPSAVSQCSPITLLYKYGSFPELIWSYQHFAKILLVSGLLLLSFYEGLKGLAADLVQLAYSLCLYAHLIYTMLAVQNKLSPTKQYRFLLHSRPHLELLTVTKGQLPSQLNKWNDRIVKVFIMLQQVTARIIFKLEFHQQKIGQKRRHPIIFQSNFNIWMRFL